MSASPLPPQRYRALRARYNALLIMLYERSALTTLEIATAAGRTERGIQVRVRALGCMLRDTRKGRPGISRGVRRPGPRPPPLNAPATRRVVAAFTAVARELAASADARVASDMERAVGYTVRRAASTQTRVIASAARELRHYAVAIEHLSAAQDLLPAGPTSKAGHTRAGKLKPAPKRPSRAELQRAEERGRRQQQARMYDAHDAARQSKQAAPAAAAPPPDPADQRINAIAERYYARRRTEPRIRGL